MALVIFHISFTNVSKAIFKIQKAFLMSKGRLETEIAHETMGFLGIIIIFLNEIVNLIDR